MITTPNAECEQLLRILMGNAEKWLKQFGEFHPFGAVLTEGGEVQPADTVDTSKRFDPVQMVDAMHKRFREGAIRGELRATAMAIDVRVVPPGKAQKSDAVCVRLDHRDGYSAEICFPYQLGKNGPQIGEPFAGPGKHEVFRK